MEAAFLPELRRRGMLVNHKRVARIMREDNLLAMHPKAFVVTPDSDHEWEVYLNLASRLAVTALEQATRERQPRPALVHHSDRDLQYASGEHVRILLKHRIIPSMSRPAKPYDNASCESFIKTLKREEIYANEYRNLEHLRENIQEFIELYYNRCRLHSALGYRPPEEFEQEASREAISAGPTLSFFQV